MGALYINVALMTIVLPLSNLNSSVCGMSDGNSAMVV